MVIPTRLDTYYCKDAFLGKRLEDSVYVTWGPYAWFNSPMYGLGNCTAYGLSLSARSWAGFAIAAFFQVSIFIFNHFVEQPIVQRLYLDADIVFNTSENKNEGTR